MLSLQNWSGGYLGLVTKGIFIKTTESYYSYNCLGVSQIESAWVKKFWSFKWQIIKTLVVDFNLDVLQAEYKGKKVAVKSLLDDSHAAQAFLAEASIMTYVWISL